jgi:glycosyltransferase involved in cell wall biosynthesis
VHKSGDTRIFHKQCTSLAKAGYDVYLVAQGESFEMNGVKVIGVPEFTGGRLKRMTQGAKSVYKKALEVNADIYQIHDPELLPYALKLKKKGKTVIFDSHEIYYLLMLEKYYLPVFIRKFISKTYYMYEGRICKKIDAVICPGTMNGKNNFENRAKRVLFIDNTPILSELYDKYIPESPRKAKAVCYIGGLTYTRGITHLIKAAYKAGADLILGGTFSPQGYFEELKALKEYQCVDYRGFVNRSEIVNILNECVVGVCTILNIGQYHQGDNLATKVYEYMSMGLPVIIYDYNHARKVNDKYNCFILVSPDNPDDIADAIKYLTDNPETARDMGQNGRQAVKQEFKWDAEAEKLLELYKELTPPGKR